MPVETAPAKATTADTGKILVVDDHEDNIEVLRVRLEHWGYETTSARSGNEALEMVRREPPDLILLDVMMPEVSGIDVAREIKGDKSLPFIPIIMQTALDSTENKVEGLEAGADDYITKPIDFAELRARVRSRVRIKGLQETVEERERELLEFNERLRYMSQTDALTGLDNRRHLNDRIEEMFAHAQRLKEPFAVVMCDLDKFKSVNDTHGHQAGDEVLKQFAAILKDEAREIDRVGRYGGEEFMGLLPAVVDILQEVSGSLHFVDVLQTIARKLGETFGLDRCAIFLSGDKDEVRLVASYEDPTIRNLVVDLNRYPELKRAFESGETVFIPDAASDPMLKSIRMTLDTLNVRSIIVVPIRC